MLTTLIKYTEEVPYPHFKALSRTERAMGTGFYSIFNASSASILAESLLKYIPSHVQQILGKDFPAFEDILLIPEPTTYQLQCWIVYVDCTVR